MSADDLMKQAAHAIVCDVALARKGQDTLIICGVHNKGLAERLVLESFAVGASPFLWVFDESLFLRCSKADRDKVVASLSEHVHSLLERSGVVIWLSQFEDIESFPADARKAAYSFWDGVDDAIRVKPRLMVNLPSARHIGSMDICYEGFLRAFANAVNVDYGRLGRTTLDLASRFEGKRTIRVLDSSGSDLTLSIEGRKAEAETGTLRECFSTGKECAIDVPAGEVYIAPIEDSANGELVIHECRDFGVRRLAMLFEDGRISSFKAEVGAQRFRRALEDAEGDKDRIAEVGLGTNYGMKLVGWSVYDEKALGTAHVAVGNNVHLGGVNKASIHVDFVIREPTIIADDEIIVKKGKLL